MTNDWIEKNKITQAVKCPFCKVETDQIVITPMGKRTAFITTNCCGMDVEVKWNEKCEKRFGKLKDMKRYEKE